MRQTIETYGKVILAAAVAVILLSLIFSLSIVRRDGVTGGYFMDSAGRAVGTALLGTDTAVDTAAVGARLNMTAPQVKTADVRIGEAYPAAALFSGNTDAGNASFSAADAGVKDEGAGKISLIAVEKDSEDALRSGAAELSGDGITFWTHGNYTVRYTVTEGGAKRTGVLYVRALRRKGDEFLT